MPKGYVTAPETRLAALAKLEQGVGVEQVAKEFGVHRETIRNWQRKFEETGSLEDGADEDADEDEDAQAAQGGEYANVLATLPAPLPPSPNGRRTYEDSYKYALARAVLAKEITYTALIRAHKVSETVLRSWVADVQAGRLKGRRTLRKPERRAPAPVPRRASQQAELWDESEHEDDEAPPPPARPAMRLGAPEPVQQSASRDRGAADEIARLQAENARLRAKLRQALAMVLDDHSAD